MLLACRVQSWIGRILSYLIPAARVVTAVRLEDMSQDLEVLAKYRAVSDQLARKELHRSGCKKHSLHVRSSLAL